jgi:hypothetical protein
MDNINYTEIVGYIASAILMVSFSMKDVTKLRFINAFGCLFFIIYGFMLATSWPIIITNGFILGMNIWHLVRSSKI